MKQPAEVRSREELLRVFARIMRIPYRIVSKGYGRDRRCTVPVKQSARR